MGMISYLYNLGEQIVGWEKNNYVYSNESSYYWGSPATISFQANQVVVSAANSGSGRGAKCVTSSGIDFTKVSKLYINVVSRSGDITGYGLARSLNGYPYGSASVRSATYTNTGLKSYDMSDLTGDIYISLFCMINWNYSATQTVNSVYLEYLYDYSVVCDANKGTVTSSNYLDTFTLTTTTNSGYVFKGYYVNGSLISRDSTHTFTLDADVTVNAEFYSVSVLYDSELGTATYTDNGNQTITLSATPTEQGQFVGWYINSTKISDNSTYTYSVLNDVTIEARFEKIWDVDDRVDGNGAIQYTRGNDKNDVTFSVIPEANHHFTQYEVQLALSAIFPDGKLKSAGTAHDELTPSKATARVGSVDLGTLEWVYYASSNAFYSRDLGSLIKAPEASGIMPNISCSLYPTTTSVGSNAAAANMPDKSITVRKTNGYVYIRDTSYTDVTAFTTAMSGVYLYYELATPIEEDVSIDLSYPVYQGGTEQLLPENGTEPTTSPLLADIQYPDQLRTNQQFTYRECPTTQDGTATIQSLKGNTLVWNQQIENGNFADNSNWSFNALTPTIANNKATYSGFGSGVSCQARYNLNSIFSNNHDYLICFDLETSAGINSRLMVVTSDWYVSYQTSQVRYSSKTRISYVLSKNDLTLDFTRLWFVFDKPNDTNPSWSITNFIMVDLTQLNNSAITDATSFRSYFSLPYYAYDSGSLLSFNGTGIKTVGRNLFNPSSVAKGRIDNGNVGYASDTTDLTVNGSQIQYTTIERYRGVVSDFIEVKPSTVYYLKLNLQISTGGCSVYYDGYDENKNWLNRISGSSLSVGDNSIHFTTFGRAKYVRFSFQSYEVSTTTLDNIMFIDADTSYEPYQSSTLYFTTATQYFTETPLYLHLRSDIIITAYFVEDDKFHITASTDFKYGSIYISDNDVYSGTVVTLWARPFPDYNFVQWDDGTYTNPKSITVTEDVTIVAEYQRVLESNGIYQYRCFVKDQLDMEGSPKAFMVVDTFDLKRDIMTKATSSITVLEMAGNVNDGDVIVVYDPKGTFLYNGVINSISDKTIKCSQMPSFYKGTWIYNTSAKSTLEQEIATLLQDYADGKMYGATWVDGQVAQRLGGITIDYVGSTSVSLPTDDVYQSKDMEDFIYELYEKYNIIFDFEINISGTNYVHIKVPTYSPVKVGNNMYAIQDMSPITTIEETNKLIIYGTNKSYRATYIATKNSIVKEPNTTANRFDITNTAIVFSDDPEADLVANNLPETMYNHKLTFRLIIKNFIYQFDDFKLGGSLDVYHNDDYYNSVLTGYQIKKSSNKNITEVSFTCGKVRNSLTNKLTLRRVL